MSTRFSIFLFFFFVFASGIYFELHANATVAGVLDKENPLPEDLDLETRNQIKDLDKDIQAKDQSRRKFLGQARFHEREAWRLQRFDILRSRYEMDLSRGYREKAVKLGDELELLLEQRRQMIMQDQKKVKIKEPLKKKEVKAKPAAVPVDTPKKEAKSQIKTTVEPIKENPKEILEELPEETSEEIEILDSEEEVNSIELEEFPIVDKPAYSKKKNSDTLLDIEDFLPSIQPFPGE
ncbi:MAG: hypothetical protein CMO81_03425 [Waddliaceae bacterium]|nr:hypothetical protein [Waddliaceae bacterium]